MMTFESATLGSAEALLLLSNNLLLLGPLVFSLGAMVVRASLCSQVVLLHCDADTLSSNLLVLGPLVFSLGMMVLRASICSQVVLLQYDADSIV
ncbi:hypothetical protein SPRG_04338 [Saprolegnia parasitica CBS 223.65]|uniref:Uncharacterized protein n=1 Tax=Saprolegnia parasitica (strain CBS 223.65) TaxID=695850 RepID=A0A067CV76_SAPPC|nr:hypothetical protein SPRG_04338 [Saprolegnia parasitica CBS 223.65]KDO30436.1 hypothetical protein SPRG_04338 [Saprolegnia parasitica CBS 223.65]|eukprot:XP_012198658.1 hypothetical protein SPRG_04338 [Saprolegnia parasitica CBS 223.65]